MNELIHSIISDEDKEIAEAIILELDRQTNTLELIASESIATPPVMLAQATVLMNKYAEGYPDRRYYGGCKHIDTIEQIAIDRVKELFGAEYANVQPHSGTQANMAVYFAMLRPGDTILSMDLAHGGHLSHGSKINFSGRLFNFIHYGVSRNGFIEYDKVRELAIKHRPRMIIAGASAYSRAIDFKTFADISKRVNAIFMVDMAHIAGLVATGEHTSPVDYADIVTSTTHKTLRGPRGGFILAKESYGKKIDSEIFPGMQGGPAIHTIAAKAIAFKSATTDEFKLIQKQIILNARLLAERLVNYGFDLISGGTDNHLMLIDLTNIDMTGKEAETILEMAGITVNKNMIPFDKHKPSIAGGIRIGTPAITMRGMCETEILSIAEMIFDVLSSRGEEDTIRKTKKTVEFMCSIFPIHPEEFSPPLNLREMIRRNDD